MKSAVKFATNRPKRSGEVGCTARVRAMGAHGDVMCAAWVQPDFTDARQLHRRHSDHNRRKSLFVYGLRAMATSSCTEKTRENGDVAVHIRPGW